MLQWLLPGAVAQLLGFCLHCLPYMQTYDNANSGIMLHDIVEVVGVLSHAPQLAAMHWGNGSNDKHGEQDAAVGCGGGADMDAEMAGLGNLGDEELGKASMLAASPPSSSMMRLHALLVNKVSSSALLPMTAAASAAGGRAATADASSVSTRAASAAAQVQVADAAGAPAAPVASNSLGDIPRLRAHAVRVLAACLGGDELAAEYLLLQLLARVTIRCDEMHEQTTRRDVSVLHSCLCAVGSGPDCVWHAQLHAVAGRTVVMAFTA